MVQSILDQTNSHQPLTSGRGLTRPTHPWVDVQGGICPSPSGDAGWPLPHSSDALNTPEKTVSDFQIRSNVSYETGIWGFPYKGVVQSALELASWRKIDSFKSEKKEWHQEHFGYLSSKIKEAREELTFIQQGCPIQSLYRRRSRSLRRLITCLQRKKISGTRGSNPS